MGATDEDLELGAQPAPAEESETLRVHSLEVMDYRRIEYAFLDIPPEGVFTIGGPNESGKTSLLSALELMLGDGALPAYPIRQGAHKAKLRTVLKNGEKVEVIVQLDIDAKGPKLKLVGADGQPFNGGRTPKTFLKGLISKLAIDPFEFLKMKPQDQDAVLKQLDPEATEAVKVVDAKAAAIFEERTGINREVKNLSARLEVAKYFPDAPAEEENIQELSAEHERRVKAAADRKAELERLKAADEKAASAVDTAEKALTTCDATIADLEKQLAELTAKLAAKREAREKLELELSTARDSAAAAHAARDSYDVAPAPGDDPEETRQKLATIQETNNKVRANAERQKLQRMLAQAETDSQAKSDELEELKSQRAEILANAKYPVQGLGFNDLGPTYRDLPLDQASNAHRIKIGAMIGMALNPKLRMIVLYDGEKLGTGVLAELEEFAREKGFQIIVERFTEENDGCSVILKDGKVLSRAPQAAE